MATTQKRRFRARRPIIACLGGAAVIAALTFPTPALAAVNTLFELDGNVLDNGAALPSSPDWGPGPAPNTTNSIFTVPVATGPGVPRVPLPTNFLSAGFSRDFLRGETSDPTTFTGGSKDDQNIAAWKCVGVNNVTDKGDIQNGYAAAATDPVTGNLLLYFGMEKNAPNGDNNMGVWFVQNESVGCLPTGGGSGTNFTGNHTDGDILLVAAFSGGGSTPTVSAYRWNGGATGSLSGALTTGGACGTAAGTNLCAITNDAASVTTPWLTNNKDSSTPQNKTGEGTTLGPDQFYEGAIDLTANNLDEDSEGNPICVNRFVFNTRASTSIDSSLFDFTVGNVETCAQPAITTELFKKNASPPDTSLKPPNSNTVTLPAMVYDTAAITGGLGTLTGTVTYSLWTNNTCTVAATSPTFAGGGNTATVTIAADGTIPPSPTLTFTTPGNFWWQAMYSGGGRNDPATSACASEPLVVQKVQPTIATTPNPTSIVVGSGSIRDTATISNGFFPSGGIAPGNVTFNLYGPFASSAAVTCTTSIFTSVVGATRVNDTTATAQSGPYTPTQVGVYQWVAAYAGNAQNLPVASTCNDTTEQVVVSPATPPIATKILLSDSVKVSAVAGAGVPTGSVLFQLYASADCTGAVVYSETRTIAADGTAQTQTPFAVVAGTYAWKTTFTSTNPNYTGAATVCSAAQSDEKAVISYAGTSPIT